MKQRALAISLALALVGAGMMTACSSKDPGPPTITSITPASGLETGGTAVTIAGTNLKDTSRVTFGGAAASITVAGDSSVTCVTPAHAAGAVQVVLTTPDGTASSSYTYTRIPGVTPTAGRWVGGGIQFFVAPGGGSITSAGSTVRGPDGRIYALCLGPLPSRSCGAISICLTGTIPVTAGSFDLNDPTFSVDGRFPVTTQGAGTWAYSVAQCGSGAGGWAANWAAARSAGDGEASASPASVIAESPSGVVVFAR